MNTSRPTNMKKETNTYTISHNEGEEIGIAHVDLDEESCMNFLLDTHAELYSVGEYDGEEECVERLNGAEWLEQRTELRRCLKTPDRIAMRDGEASGADTLTEELMRVLNDLTATTSCRVLIRFDRISPANLIAAAWPRSHADEKLRVVLEEVILELKRATKKFPQWPTDPVHAVNIVAEELGELQREINQHVYSLTDDFDPTNLRTEAIQLAAMSLRFLLSMKEYKFTPAEQHTLPP